MRKLLHPSTKLHIFEIAKEASQNPFEDNIEIAEEASQQPFEDNITLTCCQTV
jgi:hypothetical protein